MVANLKLPNPDCYVDLRQFDDEKGELGTYGGNLTKFESEEFCVLLCTFLMWFPCNLVSVRINHDGEINRARAMPQGILSN